MSKATTLIEKLEPAPKDVQEAVLTKYRGEGWVLDVSDRSFMALLIRKGWNPVEESGSYARFLLPERAITIRARSSVENPRKPSWVEERQQDGEAERGTV